MKCVGNWQEGIESRGPLRTSKTEGGHSLRFYDFPKMLMERGYLCRGWGGRAHPLHADAHSLRPGRKPKRSA